MEISLETIYESLLDNTPELALNKGKTAIELDRLNDAIKHFTKAIMLDNSYSDAYFNRGHTYRRLEIYDKAIDDYEKLGSLSTSLLDVSKSCIGGVYFEMEQYSVALKYIDEAISINSNSYHHHYTRGITKLELQKFEGALFDFNQCLRLNPEYYPALEMTFKAKQQMSLSGVTNFEDDEALEILDNLIELSPFDGMAYFNRALTFWNSDQKEKSKYNLLIAYNLDFEYALEELEEKFNLNEDDLGKNDYYFDEEDFKKVDYSKIKFSEEEIEMAMDSQEEFTEEDNYNFNLSTFLNSAGPIMLARLYVENIELINSNISLKQTYLERLRKLKLCL